jgi:hypothetical protein
VSTAASRAGHHMFNFLHIFFPDFWRLEI